MSSGSVALVGAGPGDVELLTLGALKAIQSAELILYDALIAPSIIALFPVSARSIYVGKRCGQHALSQERINQLLVAQAQQGLRVVRLKGGDPLIFGRGGEEINALRAAGIAYRVIPGISAFNGLAAAYALPLTLRTGSHEFRAIQGHHLRDDPSYWQDLARYEGTLIIYMGMEHLHEIARRLLQAGAPFSRPLALIETDAEARTHASRSQLGRLVRFGFTRKTPGPGLVYIGDNVRAMDLTLPLTSQEENSDGHASAHFS